MTLKEIIARLRNHPDNVLALTWVGNNYSILDLIHDLETLKDAKIDKECTFWPRGQCDKPDEDEDACAKCKPIEKPYEAGVCTECPDARRRKMVDDLFADTTTDEEKEEIWKEFCMDHKTLIKSSPTP